MISAWLIGDEQLVARVKSMPTSLKSRLLVKVTAWALKLEAQVKYKKLSGQVLKVRSDVLRSGTTHRVEESDESVIGFVTNNVAYAARHEYGFTGEESVKAHTRNYEKEHLRIIKEAFGRPLKFNVACMVKPHVANVGAYSRNINYPAHSFLRSAMKDFEEEINADLKKTIEKVAAGH